MTRRKHVNLKRKTSKRKGGWREKSKSEKSKQYRKNRHSVSSSRSRTINFF